MQLAERSYDISVGRGIIAAAGKYMNLERRVVIVTDDGVPSQYSKAIAAACKEYRIVTIPQGEASKSLATFADICKEMLDFGMQRKDAVVAVGGGVVGDIAGFAAASYMRGIDFYNVPTTLLSQVDSSIGGKTAVDFNGIKNIIGAFYQPKAVIIDTDVLVTLDKRQLSAGVAEIIKMALTSDAELFSMLENGCFESDKSEIITRALKIKKYVVETDEREASLRKILNFGHTFGHGIEALGELLHGECVALGMIPMSSPAVRKRLIPLLEKFGLPTEFSFDISAAFEFMKHDKKGEGDGASVIFVDDVGSYRTERMHFSDLCAHIANNLN